MSDDRVIAPSEVLSLGVPDDRVIAPSEVLSLGVPVDQVIPASEVEIKIMAGQSAEFDNCMIVGDLNLDALKIDGPVHFNHTVFQNSVNFESTIFNDTAYFEHSTFNGTAYFNPNFGGSTFNGGAYFYGSTFNGYAYFDDAKFNDFADFACSEFNSSTDFDKSQFNGDADFFDAKFNGSANFGSSMFNGYAIFWGAKFNDFAFFVDDCNILKEPVESKFNGPAIFRGSIFKRDGYFMNSMFNSTVDFSHSNFNSNAYFTNAKFDKETSFDDVQFNGNVSFSSCRFKDDALFEGANFNGALYLTRTKYDKLYIKWDNISSNLAYDDTAYQFLIENFRKLGLNKDADNCYYEFRVNQLLHWGTPNDLLGIIVEKIRHINRYLVLYKYGIGDKLMHILDLGAWIFYGYGKKPLYSFGWSLIIITTFGIYWKWNGLRKRQSCNRNSRALNEFQMIIGALSFSATVFLSGTKFFVDPPAIPTSLNKPWMRRAFTTERLLGALFSILFFLAIGGTIVR